MVKSLKLPSISITYILFCQVLKKSSLLFGFNSNRVIPFFQVTLKECICFCLERLQLVELMCVELLSCSTADNRTSRWKNALWRIKSCISKRNGTKK